MDLNIEAPGHQNQENLISFYSDKLNKRYAKYDFIKSIDVKVKESNNDNFIVSLSLKPEKGVMLYASDENKNENKALTEVIRKMNVQLEKYKKAHYHNVHKVSRQ